MVTFVYLAVAYTLLGLAVTRDVAPLLVEDESAANRRGDTSEQRRVPGAG